MAKIPLKIPIIFLLICIFFLLAKYLPIAFTSRNPDFHPNQPAYTNRMPELFSSAYFNLFQNHNQMLDFIAEVKNQGKLDDTPKILINFDLHSDIYHSAVVDINNGNWINTLLTQKNSQGKNLIDEVYWVLPEETNNTPQKDFYWNTQKSSADNKILFNGPIDQVFYENSHGKIVNDGQTPPPSTQTIKFHKRLLSQLPSFKDSAKQIILSFDADYFIYEGFPTNNIFYPNKFTETEIENILNSTVESLYRLGIKPLLVGASQSPEFTLDALESTINKFFRYISLYSKTEIH